MNKLVAEVDGKNKKTLSDIPPTGWATDSEWLGGLKPNEGCGNKKKRQNKDQPEVLLVQNISPLLIAVKMIVRSFF